MRAETYVMEVKSTVAAGAAIPCGNFRDKWVQVGEAAAGAFTGSVNIEGTIDGVNWEVIAALTNLAAPGAVVQVTPLFASIRINTTVAITVGTLKATFMGLAARAI